MLGATLLALLPLAGTLQATSQQPNNPDWELTGWRESAQELFAPNNGALFVRQGDDLQRSDDGGGTWRPLALPPAPPPPPAPLVTHRRVAFTPGAPGRLYVSGAGGVYRSDPDATAWELILPTADGERVRGLAVSPVDPALVYVDLANDRAFQSRLARSLDAGATWVDAQTVRGDPGTCFETVLVPHPTDPQQVFRIARCGGGRVTQTPLERSPDQGTTWATVFAPSAIHADHLVALTSDGSLAVKSGTASTYYLGGQRDSRGGGGGRVYRGDADGTTWTEVLAVSGALTGLAQDPIAPARVFAAVEGSVQASGNGGATWALLGQPDLGRISDLVVIPDGRMLFAATDQGVWQLGLP